MASDLPLRDELRGTSAYGAPQLDAAVRLNTNESAYPLPEAVVEAMQKAIGAELAGLNRYPDRDAVALRADLADYLGVTPDRVWVANGSNEVQQQILQAFGGPGRRALGFTPSYSMHPLLARGTGTEWIDGRREGDFSIDTSRAVEQVSRSRADVVFLCSPNNPTGTALELSVVSAVLDAAPGLVVVDEAYAEYARAGTPSAIELLSAHPRLVVTRTMSKAFGFAGGRVGYLAADPEVVDALQLVRLPYHLSALTQAAARAALAHRAVLLANVEATKAERDRIVVTLRDRGVEVADSDANFVFFRAGGDQAVAWRALLERGVLVRDVGVPGWLRVTAGTPAENDAFLTAVKGLTDE